MSSKLPLNSKLVFYSLTPQRRYHPTLAAVDEINLALDSLVRSRPVVEPTGEPTGGEPTYPYLLSPSHITPPAQATAETHAAVTASHCSAYVPPKRWLPPSSADSDKQPFKLNSHTAGALTHKELEVGAHPIQLYSLATPNGAKVHIVLEEICAAYPDFDYDAWRTSISGDQFTSGFVAINPNSKIPALVDQSTTPPTRVFESGAIMLYLCEKYG